MEIPIHTGVTFPVPLPTRINFSPNGIFYQYAEKQKNDNVVTRVFDLVNGGYTGTAEPREGNPLTEIQYEVQAGSGGGTTTPETVISDIYELVGNDIEKSLWELPYVKAEFFRLTGVDYYEKAAFIKRMVEDKIRGSLTTTDNNGTEISLLPDAIFRGHFSALGLNPEVFVGLIASFASGVEAFPKAHFVLRRTRKLPPITNLTPSINLANKIFTKVQLVSLLNPPATIKFSIPDGYWQYKTPSMTQQTDGTWQLNEEFWWADAFDPFVYTQFAF